MPLQLDATSSDFEQEFTGLLTQKREQDTDVNDIVSKIVADVKLRGDQALFELTEKFDRFVLSAEIVLKKSKPRATHVKLKP